jgi:hypothetical protein
MRNTWVIGWAAFWLLSCGEEKEVGKQSGFEVELVLIDSVVVDSFLDLNLAAVDPIDGRMIFKDRSFNHVFLTDSKGSILDTLDLKGEAPNQVAFPVEFVFHKGNLIVKDLEAGMSLNFFNGEFKKIKVSPSIAQGFSYIEINPFWVTFSAFQSNGKSLLVGAEPNGMEPGLMTEAWQKAEFYSEAKTGYVYDPELDSLWRFNAYPDTWEPKKNGLWRGYAFPYVISLGEEQLIGVLPRVGNQFFLYRWENSKMVFLGETRLSHPDRNDQLDFDPKDDYFLYPNFSDLKSGGKYFFIQFHTEIPKSVRDEYRARIPNYRNDPEFNEAFQKYWKYKYILVNHLGESYPLRNLPIEGTVHHLDQNDLLYIKPKSEVEMDYNVFYRYQIKSR